MEVERLFVTLGANIHDFMSKMNRADRVLGGFRGALGKLGRFAMTTGTVALGAVGAGALALGKDMLSGAGQVERYRAILETVTGSAEVAGEKLEWLRDFAAKTPFELSGLMEAATKLEAYGFQAEEFMGVLGDTSAALGKDVNAAVEALADATMGEFERLKEFGIKASTEGAEIAFNYVDKSGKQQKVMVDKNNREMIASTLKAIWNERYSGSMEKMSETWEGMISNLKDAWNAGLADVGASIMPTMKPFLGELTEFVGGPEMTGALEDLAGAFVSIAGEGMEAFRALTPLIGDVAGLAAEIADKFGPVLSDAIRTAGEILGEFVRTITERGMIDDLAEIASIFTGEILRAAQDMLPVITSVADIILDIVAPITRVASQFGLIQGAIYGLIGMQVARGIQNITTAFFRMVGESENFAATLGGMAGKAGLIGAGIAAAIPLVVELTKEIEGSGKAVEGMEEGMNELIESWDEMGRSAREARIEEMKATLEVLRAVVGEDSAEFAILSNQIQELERGLDSSVDTMREWQEAFTNSVLDSVEVGSSGWDQLLTDAENFGKDMSEYTNNLHVQIIGQYKSQNEKLHGLAVAGAQGFVEGKMEGWRDVGPQAMEDIKNQLFDIIANPEEYKEKGSQAIYEHIWAIADQYGVDRTKLVDIMDDIMSLLGLEGEAESLGLTTGANYGSGLMSALDEAGREAIDWYSNLKSKLSEPIVAQIVQYYTSSGEPIKEPGQDHMGGLVRHLGGAVMPAFHPGGLASDEVAATLQRGEFVMRRSAVQHYGPGLMGAINAMNYQPSGGDIFIDTVNMYEVPDLKGMQAEVEAQVHGVRLRGSALGRR